MIKQILMLEKFLTLQLNSIFILHQLLENVCIVNRSDLIQRINIFNLKVIENCVSSAVQDFISLIFGGSTFKKNSIFISNYHILSLIILIKTKTATRYTSSVTPNKTFKRLFLKMSKVFLFRKVLSQHQRMVGS